MNQEMVQRQGLRQEQKLSPRMVQALQVLQAPLADLRALVQTELERNPVLEELPGEPPPLPEPAALSVPTEDIDRENDFGPDEFDREIDRYEQALSAPPRELDAGAPAAPDATEKHTHFLDSFSAEPSLQEVLSGQLNASGLDADHKRAGGYIIGSLDENGWLTADVEEVARETGVSTAIAAATLKVVQEFDPPGIAARDLCECLELQLRRAGWAPDSLPQRLIHAHLEELGSRPDAELAAVLNVPPAEVEKARRTIAALDPRPGRRHTPTETVYVTPEVEIHKTPEGIYTATLLGDAFPRLALSADYEAMLADPSTAAAARAYLKAKIQEGRLFLDGLQQRQRTLLSLAEFIAAEQTDFFARGLPGLRPLKMSEAAARLGVHESTVWRAASGKYARTPQGVFELRFFFPQGLPATDGKDAVATDTVKEAVARLIARENVRHPLSDQDIADALKAQGTAIARRTVAKYREQLGFPPSHLRK